MIHLANITKTYDSPSGPVQALRGVSLTVNRGEIYGIIGRSGAGKSTLLRCLNMLEKPASGTVSVNGKELSSMPEHAVRQERKSIGMIFQHFNLLSSRTVYDNVALPLELAGKSREEIRKAVTPLLELVGLTDKSDRYPSQLSGGQKQRVGIARALANQPQLLLCDEATSALDPETTKSILRLLKDINQKLKLTIVLITHEMHVIKEICERVAVMENGSIIEEGPVFEVFTNPRSSVTREFIRTVINHDLPEHFHDTVFSPTPVPGGSLLLRLSFLGRTAEEPIIANLVRRYGIDVSILYGNIDHIQNTPFGTLIVELSGDAGRVESALNALQANKLGIEVIGYVDRSTRAAG